MGNGQPCYVIAEVGVNHNGDLDLARQLIQVAAAAGADAVKFQTFQADRLITARAPKADYQAARTDASESQLEMLRRLELSIEAHRLLVEYADKCRITFLSSVFSEESADVLDELGVVAFKIPSGELTNLPLIAHVARKGKPLIVSTGMANLDEVRDAVAAANGVGNNAIVLLHCVSNYPTEPGDVNLRAMATLEREFFCPVGYSDHTLGTTIAIAAAALGACVIEKHCTLSRSLPGPDHLASLEPDELTRLVADVRIAQRALGDGKKKIVQSEVAVARVVRKSLVAARDIERGHVLHSADVVFKRPGFGLPPTALEQLIGRVATRFIPSDALLEEEMFD